MGWSGWKAFLMKYIGAWLLSLAVCPGSAVLGDDIKGVEARWSQFRGPSSQGIGREGLRLPAKFGTNKNVIWKTALPLGYSSPCVWDDHIFVTGFDKKTKNLETICMDRSTGRILWRQRASVEKIEHVHQLNTPAPLQPATASKFMSTSALTGCSATARTAT